MLKQYITLLTPKVKEIFSKDSSGHDINHLIRVMNTALYLQKHEGGDELVIGVAAFLHDIHRALQCDHGRYFTPNESLPEIEALLESVSFPQDKRQYVLHAIEYHEIYNWNAPECQVSDVESLILQDADNLDAIGAMGIARTFSYGGAHGMVMYDENIPLNTDDYSEEEGVNEATTVHHFYHKLLKLADNMNTKTAASIAKERNAFMEGFLAQFMREWKAEY